MKNIVRWFLCIAAMTALLAALAVGAGAESGVIYRSENKWVSNTESTVLYHDASGAETTDSSQYVETGITWTFDGGVLTLDGSTSYSDWTACTIGELSSNVTEIVIGEGITSIPKYCFSVQFPNLKTVTVTKNLTVLNSNCFKNCGALTSFLVDGTGFDKVGTLDLRWIKSQSWAFATGTFKPTNILSDGGDSLCVFLSDEVAESVIGGFGVTYGSIPAYVYANEGASTTWSDGLAGRKAYVVTCRTYPENTVSHLGYQVRTKSYNGLRGKFTISGTSPDDYALVEYGTIAIPDPAKLDSALDYRLKPGEAGYTVTANKARKVAVWQEGGSEQNGNTFFVSVVRFAEDSANLKTNIFMTGYEIWRDKTTGVEFVLYTAETEGHCKSVSIYDAMIGSYKAGLINLSLEEDNAFWSVLNGCREKLVSAGCSSGSTTPYYTEDGNDLVRGQTRLSLFKTEDGTYTLIAHGNGVSSATFYGSVDADKVNFLANKYTGVDIDTVIIDSDVESIYINALTYLPSLKAVIYSENTYKWTFKASGNTLLQAIVKFDRTKAAANPNYVSEAIEACRVDLSGFSDFDLSTWAWTYNYKVKEVILPVPTKVVTIDAGSLCGAFDKTSAMIYVAGGTGKENVADLRSDSTAGYYTSKLALSGTAGYEDKYTLSNFLINSNINTVLFNDVTYSRYNSTNYWTAEAAPIEAQGENFMNLITGETTSVSIGDYTSAKAFSGDLTVNFPSENFEDIADDDMLMFTLVVKGAEKCESMTVSLDAPSFTSSYSLDYAIPAHWSNLKIPLLGSDLNKLSLETDGSVLIADAYFENLGTKTLAEVAGQGGMWLLEDFDSISLGTEGAGIGKALGLTRSGNYLYTVGSANNGQLVVTDVSNPSSPVVLGSVNGLGPNARNVALCPGGEDVMVVCRELGAYIINVKDPSNPYIRAHYDTVEQATGLCISGNYALVSCRTYGVEVIDLSDLDNPTHLGTVPTGEVQNVAVYNNVLYTGLWGDRSVKMYDITNISEPVLLGALGLHGKGDGVSVCEVNGRTYVYAAIGHQQGSGQTTREKLGLGQGNGFDIFDVTDPQNPVWCSTSYIDGRFYYLGNDFWRTHVSYDGENVYVYVTNTYNGVYIYDATDPTAPVRLAHIKVEIPPTSSIYRELTRTDGVLPFDQTVSGRGVIGDVLCDGNALYIACTGTDVYILDEGDIPGLIHDAREGDKCTLPTLTETDYTFTETDFTDLTQYLGEEQILSVCELGGYIFAAGGDSGVMVFDKTTLEVIDTFKNTANTIVYDVASYGNTLYVAEGNEGLGVYNVDIGTSGVTFGELWRMTKRANSGTAIVRAVELSPKARFAMVVSAQSEVSVVNTETKAVVYSGTTTSLLYHHNLSDGLIAGRYLGYCGNGAQTVWIDFGTEDDYETPIVMTDTNTLFTTHGVSSLGGYTDLNGLALGVTTKGYVLYDVADPGVSKFSELAVYTSVYGKPTTGGGYLISTNRMARKIGIYDVTTPTSPVVYKEITVNGNPDFAYITGDAENGYYAYIPLGHGGLIRFALPVIA